MEIIVATTNKHKLREIRNILKGLGIRGYAIRVKEDGKTFEENALKKARAAAKKFGRIAIADDSGLVVEALGGRPGVRSARFACPPSKQNLCRKLLRLMKDKKNRRAKFVCAVALATPFGDEKVVVGECAGKIICEMRGKNGFGYDPVFVPRGSRETFAEMKPSSKNRVSHRREALKKFKKISLKKIA